MLMNVLSTVTLLISVGKLHESISTKTCCESKQCLVVYLHDVMLTQVIIITTYLSVCLSVCNKPVLHQDEER